MYTDAGYGENWQPAGNNARRIDLYNRSCVVLGGLFAVGFVFIVIVVLSLIPLYISHTSSTVNSNIQVSKVYINSYTLQFLSPSDSFDPQTILSELNNRQALQAALTSIIQKDSITAGSIIEINSPSINSNRKRRQTPSNLHNITLGFNITSNRACGSPSCLTQFQSHATNLLVNKNQAIPIARYQSENSTEIYWLNYRLPKTIQSNASLVYVDPSTISSMLNTSMQIEITQNQPPIEGLITSTTTLVG